MIAAYRFPDMDRNIYPNVAKVGGLQSQEWHPCLVVYETKGYALNEHYGSIRVIVAS